MPQRGQCAEPEPVALWSMKQAYAAGNVARQLTGPIEHQQRDVVALHVEAAQQPQRDTLGATAVEIRQNSEHPRARLATAGDR